MIIYKVVNKTNGKIYNAIFNGKKIVIKNLNKWCKERNYSEEMIRYRIKHGIDLIKEKASGCSKIWNFNHKGKNIMIENLNKWCKENGYYIQKAKYRIENGLSL